MKTWPKKGYALVLAMITVIVLTIIGFGLYSSVEHAIREIKVQETGHIRGHYAALSGLRYGAILLQNPEALFALFGDVPPIDTGNSITISLWGNYNSVATDMGLSTDHDVTLVMTKRADGEFDVSAIYYY